MVFRRRNKRTKLKNLKELFLPEKGWRRAFEYLSLRIRRLPDTPHRIALGLACGVLASFTPLFGFHFLVGALLAFLVRANIFASILGILFFAEFPDIYVIIGAFIIVSAGIYTWHRENLNMKRKK